MEDYTKAQMFDITKEYINEYYHNPLDYISKNYVFITWLDAFRMLRLMCAVLLLKN